MNASPLGEQLETPVGDFGERPFDVGARHADAPDNIRTSLGSQQADLRLSRADDLNVRRPMIGRIYHKPKPMRAMHDDHK